MAETSEHAPHARPPRAGALSAAQLYEAILDQFPDVCVFVFDEELRYVLATGAAGQFGESATWSGSDDGEPESLPVPGGQHSEDRADLSPVPEGC